ncbi:CRAL-TRIO lipid binding domain [Trinorchestia longiramus]|nr:CRAL-TRIO lipid binding domain [Trinorchestia longiramus]
MKDTNKQEFVCTSVGWLRCAVAAMFHTLVKVCSNALHTLVKVCLNALHTLVKACSNALHTLVKVCSNALHTLVKVCSNALHTLVKKRHVAVGGTPQQSVLLRIGIEIVATIKLPIRAVQISDGESALPEWSNSKLECECFLVRVWVMALAKVVGFFFHTVFIFYFKLIMSKDDGELHATILGCVHGRGVEGLPISASSRRETRECLSEGRVREWCRKFKERTDNHEECKQGRKWWWDCTLVHLRHGRDSWSDQRLPSLVDGGNDHPLTIRDLGDVIHGQYAIITGGKYFTSFVCVAGGKSQDGCPIITLPDRGNFGDLSDDQLRRLLLYLTSVPPLQDGDLGFVIVMDRRNDKWTAVKQAFLAIANSLLLPPELSSIASRTFFYYLQNSLLLPPELSSIASRTLFHCLQNSLPLPPELSSITSRTLFHYLQNSLPLPPEFSSITSRTLFHYLQNLFPGLISAVYVLRPCSFLQKAISEVSCKVFKDEFKFKVEVCSSDAELHDHIDKDQLTADLGGTVPYCHEEWLEQRMALERFSASTQEIGTALRQFTQRLQEAELPLDVGRAQDLLADQAVDYAVLKDDLLAASRHGESLLACIKKSNRNSNAKLSGDDLPSQQSNSTDEVSSGMERSYSHPERPSDAGRSTDVGTSASSCGRDTDVGTSLKTSGYSSVDQLTYVIAVERLLVQLEETETTFDEFWQQHHTRLTQCLQLRRFEHQFKDVLSELESRLQEAAAMPSVGTSAQQVQERLDSTHRFHDSLRDILDRAADLRSSGQQLITCQHYAVDSIKPKCLELAQRRQDLDDLVVVKCKSLERCYALHQSADRANTWCSEGMELLAALQQERCSSVEVAVQALRKVEKFLALAPHAGLTSPMELFSGYDDVALPDTRLLLQQTVQRLEDLERLFEQQKVALRKASALLVRPVSVVSPDPVRGVHFHHHHQHEHKPLLRNGSEGSLLHNGALSGGVMADNLSLGSKLSDDGLSGACEGSGANKGKRSLVLKELLDTEKIYVSELCSVLKGYKDDMMNPDMQHLIPIQLYGKSDILFGNLEQIYLFHNDVFLRDLETCIDTPELIGLCFVQRKETFHHLYSLYCQNKPASEELRRQVGDQNLFFSECQRKLHHKLPLGAYLLKPVQRVTKYQLLLKDLLQCVEGGEGRAALQEGVDTMLAVLKCLNDSMHQVAITAFPGSLTELGKLLMQGAFSVWVENKRVLRELRIKPAQRHLFLYEKVLLFTKKTGKDNDKASYQFKCALKMSQVGLTESVRGNKGDLRKFEVWLQGRQEVYTILAPSLEVKDLWVKEIKRVLLEQFEYLKGENIKQYSARIHKGSSLNGIRPPQSPTAQHRTLRQTSSWDVGGGVVGNGCPGPMSNSASNPDGGVGLGSFVSPIPGCGLKAVRAGSKTSLLSGHDLNEDQHPLEEEEANWSSEYSASEEEEDQEIFAGGHELSSKFLVLADYTAMGPSEVSLREGDLVELVKVGCAGWWYVRVCSVQYEGWAPAAYLERVLKKAKGSTPSISSQESSSGLHHATSSVRPWWTSSIA